jgi:hypothetical protein
VGKTEKKKRELDRESLLRGRTIKDGENERRGGRKGERGGEGK